MAEAVAEARKDNKGKPRAVAAGAFKDLLSGFGFLPRIILNPWYFLSGKFGPIVREGLAAPGKPFYFRHPPPWYMNYAALSDRQKEVVRRFVDVAVRTRGRPLIERIRAIKEAFGRR